MSYFPNNPNGQATMANSAPVVIASDQTEFPVKAGTNLNTSLLALESGGNLATLVTNTTNIPNVIGTAGSAIPSKVWQIGGSDGTNARAIKVNTSGQLDIRPLTSSDQITIANSTLAVTESGTWSVRAQDGAGNGLTTNSTTYTAKFGLDANLLGTLGTAFSTAGKIDVKGADGDVFVRQSTAANLKATAVLNDGSGNAITSTSNALDVNIKSQTASSATFGTVGITASSSGDNTVLAAQGVGKKIYVYAWNLSFSGTVNAKFTDGAGGTLLAGLYYGVVNAGAGSSVSPNTALAIPEPVLWIGSANTALVLNLSGATAVGGSVSYFVL